MLRKYFVSNIAFMNSTRSEGGQTIALNTIEKLYGSINALLGDTKTYSFFVCIRVCYWILLYQLFQRELCVIGSCYINSFKENWCECMNYIWIFNWRETHKWNACKLECFHWHVETWGLFPYIASENYSVVSNYKKMRSPSSHRVVGPTMNLISKTLYSYERETMHLFIVQDYRIITCTSITFII